MEVLAWSLGVPMHVLDEFTAVFGHPCFEAATVWLQFSYPGIDVDAAVPFRPGSAPFEEYSIAVELESLIPLQQQ